jgi:hypothetical protein
MPSAGGHETCNIAADSSRYASNPHDALVRSPHADASTVAVRSPSALSSFRNRRREQIVLMSLPTSVQRSDAYPASVLLPILPRKLPVSLWIFPVLYRREICRLKPILLGETECSDAPKHRNRQFSLFFSLFAGNFQWRRVRIALPRQPVSLPFGEYLSETRKIPGNWALLTLARSLRMAEFPVLAPKNLKCLPLLPRGLPFSKILLRRLKNKPTARCRRQC